MCTMNCWIRCSATERASRWQRHLFLARLQHCCLVQALASFEREGRISDVMLRRHCLHRMRRSAGVLSIALLLSCGPSWHVVRAQQKVDALSEKEVERLRDTN